MTDTGATTGDAVDENRIALYRILDTFTPHLTSASAGSVSSIVADSVYAFIPVPPIRPTLASAERVARDFLKRVGDRIPMVIGIGPGAHNGSELSLSRHEVDRTLRVMRTTRMRGKVAKWEDLAAHALLLDLGDLIAARGDRPSGAVARLQHYDSTHHNQLVKTLELWLEAGCDLQKAAASAVIHPNTFRYRRKRVSEVGEIDLDDADARFFALLQLRLIRQESPSSENAKRDS
nr:helix-turn-helix domain-containing protein [Rhodococcus wratislaviensis]